MTLLAWLDRRFGKAEEINGGDRCPTYMFRWIVWPRPRPRPAPADAPEPPLKIYLHRFVGDDWSRDLHDHPKRFISIGLAGEYLEENDRGFRRYRAPWVRSFPARHRHRLTTPWGECWTLVIVLRAEREWGFWPGGRFVPWREYVDGPEGDAGRDVVQIESVRRRTSMVPVQTLSTSDGATVVVSAVIGYAISDLEKLYRSLHHAEDTIVQTAQGVIAEEVFGLRRSDIDPAKLARLVTGRLENAFASYGLGQVTLHVTDFSFLRAIRLVMDQRWGTHGRALDTQGPGGGDGR